MEKEELLVNLIENYIKTMLSEAPEDEADTDEDMPADPPEDTEEETTQKPNQNKFRVIRFNSELGMAAAFDSSDILEAFHDAERKLKNPDNGHYLQQGEIPDELKDKISELIYTDKIEEIIKKLIPEIIRGGTPEAFVQYQEASGFGFGGERDWKFIEHYPDYKKMLQTATKEGTTANCIESPGGELKCDGIQISHVAGYLPIITKHTPRLIEFISSKTKTPEGTDKAQTDYTPVENRVFGELHDKINEAISLHNVFSIAAKIYQEMLKEKKPASSQIKGAVSSGWKGLKNAWANKGSAAKDLYKGLTGSLSEGVHPWPFSEFLEQDKIASLSQEIWEKIKAKEEFRAAMPIGSVTDVSADMTPIIQEVYRELQATDLATATALDNIKIEQAGKQLFERLKVIGLTIDATVKQLFGQADSTPAEGRILRILKESYPNWAPDRLARVAKQVEDNSGGNLEEAIKKAKHLKLCDDVCVLMGFMTYYYADSLLFPIELGVDVLNQTIFEDLKDSIKGELPEDVWPSEAVLTETNFGEIYKTIPEKIKEYPHLSADAASDTDSFVSSVIEKNKLNLTDIVKGALTNSFKELLGQADGKKGETIIKMLQKFARNPEKMKAEVISEIAQLLKAIRSTPEPTSVNEEITPAVIQEVPRMARFLSSFTKKSEQDIEAFFGSLDDESKKRFYTYYRTISTNLNCNDETCVAVLKHIAAHTDEILKLFPQALAIGPGGGGEPGREPEEEQEISEVDYLALITLLGIYKDSGSRSAAEELKSLNTAWENYKKDPNDLSTKERLKNLMDKINRADLAEGQFEPQTNEQRLTNIMESILQQMLKEENGEKELCN
jgi:hypothetical protein